MREAGLQENKRENIAQKKRQPKTLSEIRENEWNQKKIQRERETPEQRESRLQKAREYKATYKRKSTPSEKKATRERVAAIRANWTDDQVKQDRDAARERMANVRSRRTDNEKQEIRVKDRKRKQWRNKEENIRLGWECFHLSFVKEYVSSQKNTKRDMFTSYFFSYFLIVEVSTSSLT